MTDPAPQPAPKQPEPVETITISPINPMAEEADGIAPRVLDETNLEMVAAVTERLPGEAEPVATPGPMTELLAQAPVLAPPEPTPAPTLAPVPQKRVTLAPSPNQPATPRRPVTTATTPIEPPSPERKAPEWKVLEPTDRSDPVEHETHLHVQRPGTPWEILAGSVRGKLHAHQGNWRDDAYAHGWVDDWTILVVSDGAGGSPLSRVGARLACDESVSTLREILAEWKLPLVKGDVPARADLMRLRVFLCEAARKAQRRVLQEARQRNIKQNDLNATLLLAVHTTWAGRDLVGVLQVGDGAVGLLLPGDTCKVMGVADHGEYSAQTRFITTPGIEFEFDQRVLFACPKDLRCLALMSDGVADDFFPEATKLIDLFVGDPIADMKTRGGDPVRGLLHDVLPAPRDGRTLVDWLRYEKRQSSDDRTLLMLSRSLRS